jgi:hypothetical protein
MTLRPHVLGLAVLVAACAADEDPADDDGAATGASESSTSADDAAADDDAPAESSSGNGTTTAAADETTAAPDDGTTTDAPGTTEAGDGSSSDDSNDDDTTTDEPPAISFAEDIYPIIQGSTCLQGACHGSSPGAAGLYMLPDADAAYDDLVNVPSTTAGFVIDRVEPGDSANSYLPMFATAALVPNAALTPADVDLIEQWIDEGAAP